ncbi:MAG: exodeoxyribonuclease V subunit gamma [Arsenophonus endosymbiont of Ceratovacuna japonica]
MLQVYYSNKLDIHRKFISNFIKSNTPSNPFEQEIILVQNINISQWLQIKFAENLGISANISFSTVITFIDDLCNKSLSNIIQKNSFTKKEMTWKLMTIIPIMINNLEFKAIKKYLNKDIDKHKLYQLSNCISVLFEKYLIYRPLWLESWYKNKLIDGLNKNQKWQKCLWLKLIEFTEKFNQSKLYLANIYKYFIQNLHTNISIRINLPKRIFICGITSLPFVYLEVLNAISKYIDIHLMVMSPCRYYWENINNYSFSTKFTEYKFKHYYNIHKIINLKKEIPVNILLNKQKKQFLTNPLLSSWGKLCHDNIYFISQLEQCNKIFSFVDLQSDSLLHKVQRDILELEDHMQFGLTKDSYNNSLKKRKLNKQDKSITFHSCHNKLREVEILQDYLLRLFEENTTLKPKDIIVMVHDIDSYVPYIQAVFGNVSPERYITFSILDQKDKQTYSIFQTFISLLNLPHSRFTAEEVLSLLEVQSIARRFSIYDDELLLLRKWINESGIRWGLNDEHISKLGLPGFKQNTWNFGLKRMFLGYAMDSNIGIWNKILPYDECIGLSAQLVGKLSAFIDLLDNWKDILNHERKLSEWLSLCQLLLNDFFEPDEQNESILINILQQCSKIIKVGIEAKYEDNVPLSLIRDELITYFNDKKINQSFFTGAMNFCKLLPMSFIPFKVICLLGMNDLTYPNLRFPLGFDLMDKQPQCGDKNYQDDDRYLFLEVLMSVSQLFYISYINNTMCDNKYCHPSILVNELLNYISQSFYLDGDEYINIDNSSDRIKEYLVIKHTQVPFALENYLPNNIHQSYATEWLSAAKKKGNLKSKFCTLLSPIINNNEISLNHLLSFYKHPIRFFFQQRLKVNFSNKEIQIPDHEPFIVNNLQRYKFNKLLIKAIIYEYSLDELFIILRSTGKLPVKHFGKLYWEKQMKNMFLLANKIKKNYHECFNKSFNEKFDNIYLVGQLKNIQQNGIIRYRPANLTINDGLSLWIEHLIFCLTVGLGESYYWGNYNSEWCFKSVDPSNAKLYLQQLIDGYQKGLNSPLPLFNKSAWKWLMSCYDQKNNQFDFNSSDILQKAKIQLIQSLQGTYNILGEIEDKYINRVFNKIDNNLLEIIMKNAQIYLLPIAIYKKQKNIKNF